MICGYLFLRILGALMMIVYLIRNQSTSYVWTLDDAVLQRWQTRMVNKSTEAGEAVWQRALKDLLNPFFFLSLSLMVGFHFYIDSSFAEIIWIVCRTVAIGFIFFYLSRSTWAKKRLIGCFGQSRKFRHLYRMSYRVKNKIRS